VSWLTPIRLALPLATFLAGLSEPCASGATVVTGALLEAVAQIESGGGQETVGDGGKARGWWQMHAAAWQDTTAYRARKGAPTWDYDQAQDPDVARHYARDYLTILENQIRVATGDEPAAEMIYAAYNVGFGRLQSLGFDIEKTRPSTQSSCARLRNLITLFEQTTARGDAN